VNIYERRMVLGTPLIHMLMTEAECVSGMARCIGNMVK